MNLHDFERLLEQPAVQLVRARNAAMVFGFFHRTFKQQHRLSVAEGELRGMLESHLDELRHENLFAVEKSAAEYLEEWCGPQHGWLKKYYPEADASSEAVFELTAASEKALLWLESFYSAEFVGTESRLELIFQGLEQLLTLSSGDKTERLRLLREDEARIAAEIARIELTGKVTTLSPVQVNERFHWLLATSRELLSDFRQVEENFKRIGRDIAERHTQPDATRGGILGHLLDAYEALHETAQGQSFYGFWNLLLAHDRQERFRESVERVYSLDQLEGSLRADRMLGQLIGRLLREGEKIIKSNERMAGNLRRVLETARLGEHRRMREIIREIQADALRTKDAPPTESEFSFLDELPPFYVAMSREAWHPGEVLSGTMPAELADDRVDQAELRRLRELPHIQLAQLRRNVEMLLEKNDFARLDEVLAAYPPRYGMMEVLGYVAVALDDRRHLVSDDQTQVVELASGAEWRMPMVLFSRHSP